jgi:Fe(3+) dicitrate transport protein
MFEKTTHQLNIGISLTSMNSEITSGSLTDADMFSSVVHTNATQTELIEKINNNPAAYEVYVDGVVYTGEVTDAIFGDITKLVITYGDGKAEGYEVPYVPSIIFNGNVNYKFNIWGVDVSMNYTGEQYTDFFNMDSESGDGSIGKLPAYYYVNANLNYMVEPTKGNLKRTTFFIAGKNITNNIYRASRLNRATGGLFPYGFMQINGGVSITF